MDLINIIPNLSIGVISIGALVYLSLNFIKRLESKDKECKEERTEMLLELKEREIAFRNYVHEITEKTMGQLNDNTQALERIIKHLDNH